MKFVSFLRPDGTASHGLVESGRIRDLGAVDPESPDLRALLAHGDVGRLAKLSEAAPAFDLAAVALLPVIPNPGKIVCVALNYRGPGAPPPPEYPALFLRAASSQTAHLAPLVKPRLSDKLDFEGELVVVIGRGGRHISEQQALGHVAGYSCYNDASVRDWQRHSHQWTPGKNFDATGAFGPWLVTPNEMPPFQHAFLRTRLNGVEMQKAPLSSMIFSVAWLISYVSRFATLEPGDVIVTGTPEGVGDKRQPPVYLRDGDVVEVEIDGIGRLENRVAAEHETEDSGRA
ncbi:2-keto-4-pentenoate hydratase/2-oxohepta-3-ene-1,7-dioic acid hydratase in catechol pathway [Rhodoblastus acidophilus]|uniref:fumarylacetoacetate hydrolase family protein n=1 Tax=Rhodoblastus acidophilus TaxID=1074 RepID=UPI0022243E41|nr:fumarylacetoacetate hydrolase family protein [Rhodoblastus acidophilus]MCW2286451.1 2-keto-4-pentenoate hydratase/2-oxohepta-3-ene-1,7-dioic acid hydratase in catechol pathway [Rhodoblastus acidophilus]MCW2335300.1 2-keto-4-pentenoate hydratase/2-oxohepta-3-ene-1,7-dioic acid hydratase in catechol pathway [Rhodoblastus acidophilus]